MFFDLIEVNPVNPVKIPAQVRLTQNLTYTFRKSPTVYGGNFRQAGWHSIERISTLRFLTVKTCISGHLRAFPCNPPQEFILHKLIILRVLCDFERVSPP
ncbi:hypothetical protein HQ447_00175 [bacterium]|nr:hypothetical protein [bacterium]